MSRRILAASLAALASLVLVAPAAHAQRGPAPRADSTRAPRTVAVLYFDNATGSAEYDAMGRGIAAMLITDLSGVPEVRIVERERLQAVVDEQRLQNTPMFDPATAVKAGKLLGAEYLLVGAFTAVRPQMRIDTRVVRVETGEIVRTAKVQGQEDKFFELQQKLAKELVSALPTAVSPEAMEQLRQQQERNRINDTRTMVDFSQGLARFDQRDYVGAVEKLGPAMLRAPDALIVRLTYDEAKKRSTNNAKNMAREKARAAIGGFLKRP